jgi:hypothetical protein
VSFVLAKTEQDELTMNTECSIGSCVVCGELTNTSCQPCFIDDDVRVKVCSKRACRQRHKYDDYTRKLVGTITITESGKEK